MKNNGGEWREDYTELKDLRVSLDIEELLTETGFIFSMWLYLLRPARSPYVILRQVDSGSEREAPFLALDEHYSLAVFPIMFLHEEAPSSGSSSSFSWTDSLGSELKCPFEKWIHIGCEVALDSLHVYVDGKLASGKPLSSPYNRGYEKDDLKKICLIGNKGNDEMFKGYAYHIQFVPVTSSIKDEFEKNPPIKLSIDKSSLQVDIGHDGVWNLVGGKASGRRIFTMEVVLLDAMNQPVDKELKVFASLAYSDNGITVVKSGDDAEPPLLTVCDGLEFPSTERPVKLVNGRGTFKLKLSQLSSKSDNRLFRVCFRSTGAREYPFLTAFSPPIRSTSRRIASIHQPEETHLQEYNDGTQIINDLYKDPCFTRLNSSKLWSNPASKRWKSENGSRSTAAFQPNRRLVEKEEHDCVAITSSKLQNNDQTDGVSYDSRSTGLGVSDKVIFKYCLDGIYERSVLLKEILPSTSDEDIANFAERVCMYTGCSHHGPQVMISRQLVEQGEDAWQSISRNKGRTLWGVAAPEIHRRFITITRSANRTLSEQDLEVLQGIAGCQEEMGREDFNRLWSWLYPVAYTLSKDPLDTMWRSTKPRWIEGFITREEAEESLRGPGGCLRVPGTFVLRFPTNRSWPHPDAGRLVVSYVGTDSVIHHRLLATKNKYDDSREVSSKRMQDLLLEEPVLSQLGSVVRRARPKA